MPTNPSHPCASPALDKVALRATCRKARAELAPRCGSDAANQAGRAVAAHVSSQRTWLSGHVALYAAFGHELDPRALASLVRSHGGQVLYPRIAHTQPPTLEFHVVSDERELTIGPHGFPEPAAHAPQSQHMDVVVIPGVAFDRAGGRLGSGRGFYDRALRRVERAIRVGLFHTCQLVARVPMEPHDEAMDWLLSPEGLVPTSARSGRDIFPARQVSQQEDIT